MAPSGAPTARISPRVPLRLRPVTTRGPPPFGDGPRWCGSKDFYSAGKALAISWVTWAGKNAPDSGELGSAPDIWLPLRALPP